jgi:hypothetical protein
MANTMIIGITNQMNLWIAIKGDICLLYNIVQIDDDDDDVYLAPFHYVVSMKWNEFMNSKRGYSPPPFLYEIDYNGGIYAWS